MKKVLLMALVALISIILASTLAFAGSGNGAPVGAHYNLNIIGVQKDKIADMTDSNRHVIFVKLEGRTNIMLCESGEEGCEDVEGFSVLDGNGTDGEASFALPNPDPDGDGETIYSVFARALGKPGGSADMQTCATDPIDGSLVCSVITLELKRDKGKSKFDNVTKYLLYIYADTDGDGYADRRIPLFDDSLVGYFWDYDNNGLKLAQLRFYQCATIVPDPSNPDGNQIDLDCFTK